jgi:hypothetical protein
MTIITHDDLKLIGIRVNMLEPNASFCGDNLIGFKFKGFPVTISYKFNGNTGFFSMTEEELLTLRKQIT